MSEIKLIDISEHQGTINWDILQDAYNAGEISGVIMRGGYGSATGVQKDAQYDRNRSEARKRGIPNQTYVFAYPGRSTGATHARGLAQIIGQLQAGESVSLDMEDEPTYGRRLVASDVDWALDFIKTLQAALGPVPLTYMNSDVLARFDWSPLVKANSGLWLANYGSNSGVPGIRPASGEWPFIAIWQYSSRGNVRGITPLDMNLFSGDKAAFFKYGLSGTPPVQVPVPQPTAPAPVAGNGTSYGLGKSVPGYVNAGDAKARTNSNSTVPAGTYYVFNQAYGMVNISRSPGVAGWWINPSDAPVASAPAAPSGNYKVEKSTPGYVNASDAAAGRNAVNTVQAGNYLVFNTYKGMVNVTTKSGVPGSWINPTAANGAAANPAAQASEIKIPSGATLGIIAGQWSTTVDQLVAWNKAKYPSITPNYIQAGWVIRVR